MRSIVFLLTGLAILALGGCDAPAEPATPTLNGRFTGETAGISVDVALNEQNGQVSGSGTMLVFDPANPATPQTVQATVTGSHVFPSVALTAANPQGAPIATYAGSFVDANQVSGTVVLIALGASLPLTLHRQP